MTDETETQAATIWIRGETGLMAFSELPAGIAARLGKDLFRVNKDGSPWVVSEPQAGDLESDEAEREREAQAPGRPEAAKTAFPRATVPPHQVPDTSPVPDTAPVPENQPAPAPQNQPAPAQKPPGPAATQQRPAGGA